jgi:2-(3-amino-3-carboxypropyl)histidine synthase
MGVQARDCILGESYRVDLTPLSSLPRRDYDIIVLQAPEGLQKYLTRFSGCISGLVEGDVIIHGDPVYGACDLHLGKFGMLASSNKRILVIHIGHTPYPPDLGGGSKPSNIDVVYLNAESLLEVDESLISEAISIIKEKGYESVGLVATVQHAHILKLLEAKFRERGIKAVVPRGYPPYFLDGQVIGCDYRVAKRISPDAYVIVAGGLFHAIGLYLATLRDVIQLDPYSSKVRFISPLGMRLLKKRLYLVANALTSRSMAIIVGLKDGQFRPHIVQKLVKLAKDKGLQYYVIASDVLNEYSLRNIDNDDIEFYVVTSCPRIAIDDLGNFEKPVLTPGEAFMALEGRLEPYRFPW